MAVAMSVESEKRRPERGDSLIVSGPGEWTGQLNKQPIVLRHTLAGNPLFSLERLAELADFVRRERGEDRVSYRKARTTPHTADAWSGLSHISDVANAIRNCEESGAWIILQDAEVDPEYNALIRQVVSDLSIAVGRDLLAEAVHLAGFIFIGSPNSVTDYHIDSETNFLCIARGEKEFHLFDGDDRTLLSEEDIEKFYWGELHAGRVDAARGKADHVFHLKPGDCLHIPVNFPHWVKNGPSTTIALSILLYLPEDVERAHAYQANGLLRSLGFRPGAIGRDRARDRRRGWLFRMLSTKGPLDKREVITSGRKRLQAPLVLAKRVAKKLLRRT